ncbi:hypothetical protein ABZ864_40790 [Streptomyces sp. NPDC047082]|uniref:hypothetical protein n=1 Tax=Streptomyces sp. NPDC047082 TaxID=3155259 RepID=UPI0033F62D88
MSTQAERDGIGTLLLAEWATYRKLLDEAGESWQTTKPSDWPGESNLHTVHRGIALLARAARIVGAVHDPEELNRQHEERLEAAPLTGISTAVN